MAEHAAEGCGPPCSLDVRGFRHPHVDVEMRGKLGRSALVGQGCQRPLIACAMLGQHRQRLVGSEQIHPDLTWPIGTLWGEAEGQLLDLTHGEVLVVLRNEGGLHREVSLQTSLVHRRWGWCARGGAHPI